MAHTTRVLQSEWTKVRTVRSTLWTLLSALLVTVGIGVLISLVLRTSYDDLPNEQRVTFDATFTSFSGMTLGQLAMIAFGVLVVSGEYSSGMIRTSLAAVPQRGVFMAAKTAVATGLVLLVGMVTSFLSFFFGQMVLGSELNVSIGDPGVLRAVIGGGLYMTLITLFAMGVTWMLRSPMLAFGTLMPFFFLISSILGAVPATRDVAQYLPDQAGTMIMTVVENGGGLDRDYGPWGGLLIMAAWTLASMIGGYLVLKRRDA